MEERRKDDLTKVEPIPGYGHMKFLEDDWQGSPTEVFWSRDWPLASGQCNVERGHLVVTYLLV